MRMTSIPRQTMADASPPYSFHGKVRDATPKLPVDVYAYGFCVCSSELIEHASAPDAWRRCEAG